VQLHIARPPIGAHPNAWEIYPFSLPPQSTTNVAFPSQSHVLVQAGNTTPPPGFDIIVLPPLDMYDCGEASRASPKLKPQLLVLSHSSITAAFDMYSCNALYSHLFSLESIESIEARCIPIPRLLESGRYRWVSIDAGSTEFAI